MNKKKTGYYWVNYKGEMIPARFDGDVYYHGYKILHPKHIVSVSENTLDDPPQCQTGCTCTQNADGSWTIVC